MAATSEMSDKPAPSRHWVARVWKHLMRQEIRLARWMLKQRVPPFLVTSLLWLPKLALVLLVGYLLFWLAVVLAFVFIVAWVLRNADPDETPPAPEWRQGFQGFGLYDQAGLRIDPHDPTADD